MELGPKRLELLHELVPTATIVALLINPTSPEYRVRYRDLQAAARTLGLQLHVLQRAPNAISMRSLQLVRMRAGALVIGSDHSSIAGANSSPH